MGRVFGRDLAGLKAAGTSSHGSLALARLSGLLFFAAVMNLPFVDQAFHMDDGIYLLLAKNVVRNPWFPQDVPVRFEGFFAPDLGSTEHPWPLTVYLLALSARVGKGYSEVGLHLGFLVFPIGLACAMYFLARRFTGRPVLATLTLLTLPVVYVSSHTLMTDLPVLALWVASVALFSHGADAGRRSLVWLGAAGAALASFVSYAGLGLIPLLAFYAFLRRNRSALVTAVGLPAALFLIRLIFDMHHFRRFTPGLLLGSYFFVKGVLSPELLLEKCAYIVTTLGGVTLCPLALLALCRRKWVLFGLLLSTSALLVRGISGYGPAEKILFVLFSGAGIAGILEVAGVTARALYSFRDRSRMAGDDLFLGVWFLGFLLFCGAAYMNGSARYVLPATPPLVLVLMRRLERGRGWPGARWIAYANPTLAGALALCLAAADREFAEMYRSFGSTLERAYPNRAGRLWFTGEWGFRAYLERMGGEELGRRDPRPDPGDLMVVPSLATSYTTLLSDRMSLDSIALVAPSRAAFDVPAVSRDSALVYTIGMPFHDRSDGVDFSVCFVTPDSRRVLHGGRLLPEEGRRWSVRRIPLAEVAGRKGMIVFSVEVGASQDAEADWIAVARARICKPNDPSELALYDFREHLSEAHIESMAGTRYHTPANRPVFPLTVWLEQERAARLLCTFDYRPAFSLGLMDGSIHAGFWSMGWGLLPFSYSNSGSALETIRVYEVVRKVDAYGESELSWYAQ